MIQFYLVLKSGNGFCRITADDGVYNVFLFKNTIQEIDLENISDFELDQLSFDIPVIYDIEKFESSERSEGFSIKTFRLSSIRKFEKLKSPNQP